MNLLDRLAYDSGGYTVQEILSSFCKKILEIIDLVNKNEEVCDEAHTLIENIRNEVVPDLVDDIMEELQDNGYFDSLVNVTLIEQLRTELTTLLNNTITDYTSRLDTQLEQKADLTYVDTKIGNMGNTKTFKGSCVFSDLPTEANVDDYWYVTDKSTNYCWNETTWVDIGNNLNIGDGTITTSKLAFTPLIGIKSKNLFNKNNVTSGYYIDYRTGKLLNNVSYSVSDYIEVKSDTIYSKVTTNQFAFYDDNKAYISGVNTDTVFTTPSNCKFIRISVKNDLLDSEMIVENDNVGSYESFGSFIPKDLLPQEILKDNIEYTNFVIVSKDNPELDTINKALDKLKDVDSVDNPCVILVMPGVYEESLILAYRYVSIIGVDKDTCIITNKLNDYYKPPVDLTPNSHLKNLTIIADNDGIVEIPDVGTPGQQSYAVHFDSAGRYYNSKTEGVSRIENCILISNNYQALGSGLCINQKLICENVEFRAYKNNNAMRIHNYSLEGGSGSSAVFKDCTFISENAEPIHVQNVNDNNVDSEITFIRNVAYNNNGQVNCLKHEEVIGEGCISGNIILGKGSFGNSIAELNK